MATRIGRLSKPDAQGQFARQLGWKFNARGDKVQHKFRLGSDKREAERRDETLRRVWEIIEADCFGEATWDDTTLAIAKAVAKGTTTIPLDPISEEESASMCACRVQAIQNRFPFLQFDPVLSKNSSDVKR